MEGVWGRQRRGYPGLAISNDRHANQQTGYWLQRIVGMVAQAYEMAGLAALMQGIRRAFRKDNRTD